MGFDSSGTPEMNGSRVRTVAAPAFRQDVQRNYPGVFVVQLAGNSEGDACLLDRCAKSATDADADQPTNSLVRRTTVYRRLLPRQLWHAASWALDCAGRSFIR